MMPAPLETPSAPCPADWVRALFFLLVLVLTGCSTLPDEETFHAYYQAYERRAEAEIAELQQQRDAGEITEASYQIESDKIREDLTEKVTDAIFRDYQLRRSSREPIAESR